MAYEKLELMVAALSNEIYLGAPMKSKTPYKVMSENRRVFTDQVIRACAEHMMNLKEGEGYEFPGHGKLVWKPENVSEEESA